MKLKFIFLGKKKSSFFDMMMTDYLARLNTYVQAECVFLDEKNKNKLDKKLLGSIKTKDYLILLDEKGKALNTVEYSKFLYHQTLHRASLIFVVGDAYGIPHNITARSNAVLSLSKMTFPHMFARLILLEQTYRAFSVLNNHPYHHE
tara:strand:- start:3356 stop:3796 length:441 start_codon:yes stop_codon:yes gene_type:complete